MNIILEEYKSRLTNTTTSGLFKSRMLSMTE